MRKNSTGFLITPLILGLATACGKSSDTRCAPDHITHDSSIQLENYGAAAGRTITFCRGGFSPTVVTVQFPSDPTLKRVKMDSVKEATHEPTRWDGSCNDMVRERRWVNEAVPVALTSASFRDIKLCYRDSRHMTVSLIDKTESCPEGSSEQKSPVDACETLGTDTRVLDSGNY